MRWFLLSIIYFLLIPASCKKEKNKNADINTPVPFLTGIKWTADTITINPPLTFNQLSAADQQTYIISLGFWSKHAQLTFNEDGSVTCAPDYASGYTRWRLINNKTDIEMLIDNGQRDTLFNWTADSFQFTYLKTINQSYNCTWLYK